MTASPRRVSALNAGYLEELYERYLERPEAVDPRSRAYFDGRDHRGSSSTRALLGTLRLAEAIRANGHRAARIDPLGLFVERHPGLEPDAHDLTDAALDLVPASVVGGPPGRRFRSAREAIEALRGVYCGARGYDYAHVSDPREREWLAAVAESGEFRPPNDPVDAVALLTALSRTEAFETFLHRMLPGRFRFSIEGLDMLVPLLEEILGEAAEHGVRCMHLGMPHRGRLNVLAHVLQKPCARIFAELREAVKGGGPSEGAGFHGDVTYHMGARRARRTGDQVALVVNLPPNPSHLEAIDPVVYGMARAASANVERGGAPRLVPGKTLPVLVHGDAAFAGQGVVAETLNLGGLPAYHAGGTVHVIANNVLGFTTEPRDLHATRYASDLAKGFDIPVLHVNADEPESVIEAARTAVAYLARFRKDFVIDLVGYRRRGHNESDEPRFTQPLRYASIDRLPTVRESYARRLVERGVIGADRAAAIHEEALDAMREAWEASQEPEPLDEAGSSEHSPRPAPRADTAVSLDRLRRLNEALLELPEGFSLHPKLGSAREKRREALDDPSEATIDWATAEELAFAAVLEDGVSVRLTGEDTERGTFIHRHAVFHDVENGETHTPLQSFPQARAAFEIANSPLSENAALGFELGYDLGSERRLVLWEAQYGDFINGAQVVVDEFIVSARAKWGLEPSLVLLLPHGHEGHGPDHSSGRLERFLLLAAGDNMRVANVTTAAQYFHLLRRQAALLENAPRPLVVFTPKALLRDARARSSPRELAEGAFAPVLDDPRFADPGRAKKATRLVLLSGKLYVDILRSVSDDELTTAVPVCRLEQLYPFPAKEIDALLTRYGSIETLVWAQEEPRNMGAFRFVEGELRSLLPDGVQLVYAGREASPSPAEGSARDHERRQRALIEEALGAREKEA